MPVCIAGMHRSGTSMVTNLLHRCGLYLGPARDLMPPNFDNPDGYWEHLDLHRLNDELLAELGGAWDYPPPAPRAWNDAGFAALGTRAEVLLSAFRGHEPWGWKDPRNSLTFPFWETLQPNLRAVIAVRNPLEVARSLGQRNGISSVLALALWTTYNQRILDATRPDRRIVTHFDAYFPEPQTELRRVLTLLDMSVSDDVIDQAATGRRNDLRHHRFAARQLREANVSPALLDLYDQLCAEAERLDDGLRAASSEVRRRPAPSEAAAEHAEHHGAGPVPAPADESGGWPGGSLFDARHWPAYPVAPPLSGPVWVLASPVGLHTDHWLGHGPMHLRLVTTGGVCELTIRAYIPPEAEDPMLLKLVVNGVAHRRAFPAGSSFAWTVPCRCVAGEEVAIVLSGGRGFVPAEHGLADQRRLTVRLSGMAFAPDPAVTRCVGPVSILAADNASERFGARRFAVEGRAGRTLRSVTIRGEVRRDLEAPLELTATANGQSRSWSTRVLPGLPFRWVLPYAADAGTRISLDVKAEGLRPAAASDANAAERTPPLLLKQISFDPDVPLSTGDEGVVLSTVLLSHNRPDLLRLTLESYLATVSVPYEMIVVDNDADDETRSVIAEMSERHPSISAILLPTSTGGAAIDRGLAQSRGAYVHISENGLEYLPGWDRSLLTKLELFPKLGQLSLRAPGPNAARPWTVEGLTVHLALGNVVTPSVMPREAYEAGAHWTTPGGGNALVSGGRRFSDALKEHGYLVAWNDTDLVITHTFLVEDHARRLPDPEETSPQLAPETPAGDAPPVTGDPLADRLGGTHASFAPAPTPDSNSSSP